MRSFAAVTLGCLLVGCSSGNEVTPALYDACFNVDDCVEGATRCEELVVEFAGFEYSNAICTTECAAAGAISPDCSRALIGRLGSCYPSRITGGLDDSMICFEPCDTDASCLQGFRCLGALELCGATPDACPVDPFDAICVPGPL